MDLEQLELGHNYSANDLKNYYKQIYGGVAWPGERSGFAVIVGMGRKKHFDNYDVYLLDEFEFGDTRQLVQQCGVLDFKYQPTRWIGDRTNDAADRFIQEMNDEVRGRERPGLWWIGLRKYPRYFCVESSWILNMQYPFQYIFPNLKRLLDKDRRQLFLKDSKTVDYLAPIAPDDISAIKFGEFPAIEALALAVIQMRKDISFEDMDSADETDIANSYSVKSAF